MTDKVQKLEKSIRHHKALYYQGRPEISDQEFDKLEESLRKLDPKNKVLEMVGALVKNSQKVKHETKMLSLQKTYKEEDLLSWIDKRAVVSMFKIDGVSLSLVYENGHLVTAKTRGDGTFGENITPKAQWMNDIPQRIKDLGVLEIRGEAYCTEENFIHLAQEMENLKLERPTSLRNVVAGLFGRKENIELARYLSFQAFEIIGDHLSLKEENKKFDLLNKLNFLVPETKLHTNQKEISRSINEAQIFMSEGNYLIDGLVIVLNDLQEQEELGNTSHHPRYKMAFKFEGVAKETKIQEIIWGVSRNGVLTPVAQVEPVELSNAMISRVTLHNYGMVKQFNLKSGDKIKIIRSGEVIPKFMEVIKSSKNNFEAPEKCPVCASKTLIDDIRLYCSNLKCPARLKESVLNFIQKIGIENLSSKRLDEVFNKKLIKDIPDLYQLKEEDFLILDKTKEKLAKKLFESIQNSKKVDLKTFLAALGISGGAYNKCEKIVDAGFNSLEKIKNLSQEQLEDIESFAEKSAQDFLKSLQEKIPLIEKLEKNGFIFEKQEIKETPFTGKKICITGALSEKRSVIEAKIREVGGVVVGGVSKNTDFLLTNETKSSSSKFKKAQELEIPLVSEADFFAQV